MILTEFPYRIEHGHHVFYGCFFEYCVVAGFGFCCSPALQQSSAGCLKVVKLIGYDIPQNLYIDPKVLVNKKPVVPRHTLPPV